VHGSLLLLKLHMLRVLELHLHWHLLLLKLLLVLKLHLLRVLELHLL
jgi:hypothetical protein